MNISPVFFEVNKKIVQFGLARSFSIIIPFMVLSVRICYGAL